MLCPYFVISLCLIATRSAFCLRHYKHEGHNIMRRMAELGEQFQGHDVAKIHLDQGQTRKRLTKRDLTGMKFGNQNTDTLQLQLSTGSEINLALTPSNIVDSDTVVSILSEKDRVEKKMERHDCYSYGHVEDSSGKGWAVISHCDGIFGFAGSPQYDYFVQPVEMTRSKREASEDDFDVHIMWRVSEIEATQNATVAVPEEITDFLIPHNTKVSRRLAGSNADRLNATEAVVELAVFTDEQFWKKLHRHYPGREDDFLLTMISGTQALYGNPERVGYDIKLKVKLLEHWKKDPIGYSFNNKLSHNLRSFCKHTKRKYFYDVNALNTGVTAWDKGKTGLGYVGGACTSKRCLVTKGMGLRKFSLFAHELGHILGMPHQSHSRCPTVHPYEGGFMGGGRPYNFSPCMKILISKFLKSSKSNCLYKESAIVKTSVKFNQLPRVFPGQTTSPDGLCRILAGEGYNYVPLGKSFGNPTCRWMVCYNEDETSVEFGRARRFIAPTGFPCDYEAFCVKERVCKPWKVVKTIFNHGTLRNMTETPEWSEWSAEFSACSRSCGTGVRTRRRECRFKGFNLAPYCAGMAVEPELCNMEPCPGDPDKIADLRHARGDEICKRFLRNNVSLNLKNAKGYFPEFHKLAKKDINRPASISDIHSKSCLIKCKRNPSNLRGDVDGFMSDGTPCVDTNRNKKDLEFLNIQLRCVRGSCLEFTNCPYSLQHKDECGVCGGDGRRCVNLFIDSAYDVPKGKRSYLTMIPAGSENIIVRMKWRKNRGVILELWDYHSRRVIGIRGEFPGPEYKKPNEVQFAGTSWSYKRTESYLRALGPTTENVIIRAFRRRRPISAITITYARKN